MVSQQGSLERKASLGRKIVVVGAGIGGLTAGALLAHRGYNVTVFDQAIVPGGCASTFKRKGFTFDVGATQVAGLEPGGIHHRIFSELEIDLPKATFCDPACAVYLPGETEPINVWRDPERWKAERQRQFPGSEPFWQLLADLFRRSWAFQMRDPVLPPRSGWDLWQLTKALRPDTLLTVPHTFSTVGDALRGYGLERDRRLKTFLDLQLKLYSQVDADETALLYAATALGVSQQPHGLFHLHGSMQVLSDRLMDALKRDGGKLVMRHTVEQIHTQGKQTLGVTIRDQSTDETWLEPADHVVANVTLQDLVRLLGENAPHGYQRRVEKLPPASGAFVLYLGVDHSAIPENCPPHLQFLYNYDGAIAENNSLFVSVSRAGDGRAPEGKATIIASSFTDVMAWEQGNYDAMKQRYAEAAIARLGQFFTLNTETIIHQESATPRTFQRYTGRAQGIVGGIGQRIPTFGPFGFANRTPVHHLWLVGDSTHPGEGTAGVSYSALTVVRQIEAAKR
ncbi:C-3',4' desaturase CrtD [Myxacorys almedinensis]|uniref:C-3',4' desaturase CrtD n=1 Tax=Myxacorys almedinensis A TaxID=2690445 RepID=A0A8J7Z1T7_9CYAN|nr:C-3',4' desaturase CrtD [Myxacorys almedinensis]NDJ16606.1 C-3',4' desaturase CrtD [Myxacorys almedinensis A]